MTLLDVVVCHTATFGFLVDLLIRGVGVARNDVPGVEETREEAQAAEGDVDERVCRADTALDPYCKLKSALESSRVDPSTTRLVHAAPVAARACGERDLSSSLTSDGREKDGQEAQEDIAAAHVVRLLFVRCVDLLLERGGRGVKSRLKAVAFVKSPHAHAMTRTLACGSALPDHCHAPHHNTETTNMESSKLFVS